MAGDTDADGLDSIAAQQLDINAARTILVCRTGELDAPSDARDPRVRRGLEQRPSQTRLELHA